MKKLYLVTLIAVFMLLSVFSATLLAKEISHPPAISGRIIGGYRILPIPKGATSAHFTVYRGDYIKLEFDRDLGSPLFSIPSLSIEQKLTAGPETAPYFKMKKTGTFAFSMGSLKGDITVIEYRQANYRDVTAEQAAELIRNTKPFILDVRTPAEYRTGRIENATLIPVQQLQTRLKELAGYKSQDILIYCATGNRSTVASKILIDNGFRRIINMRYGIHAWRLKGYPVTN